MKLIVSNHKMNLTKDEILSYIKEISEIKSSNKLIFCPSYPYLSFFDGKNYFVGSQNVSDQKMGAYTGEVSASQLRSLGIQYAIIGHSERRNILNESFELIHKKVKICLENNIIPILCIGEKKEEINQKEEILTAELKSAFDDIGDDRKNIVIITGFQGINKYDDMTTLGRGGSDTTAVALAAALHADTCEIYTDVDGVYTADPRIVPNARKLKEVSYDEMLEMASLGAKVLHNRSVEMAKKYGVHLVVLSSLTRSEGTVVKEASKVERMLVSGVAADNNVARISVLGVENKPGIAFKIFNLLAKNRINVDIIIQSIGREERKDISFTVAKEDLQDTMDLLETNKASITANDITSEEGVAKLSIIGAGMCSNPGVAARMFEALYGANINIKMIATSEIRITVLIDEGDVKRAMRTVHDAFDLAD